MYRDRYTYVHLCIYIFIYTFIHMYIYMCVCVYNIHNFVPFLPPCLGPSYVLDRPMRIERYIIAKTHNLPPSILYVLM